ncbi:MAG: hypothetical protein WKF97_15335 [Chitinophagaceae bacterium]
MKIRQKPSLIFLFVSCIFMMFTLAWFTVSLPFVYNAQQKVQGNKSSDGHVPINNNDEETDNPFATTTEEKTSGNNGSMSEEYIHDAHSSEQYIAVLANEYKVRQMSTYIAFYGELISPPPDLS